MHIDDLPPAVMPGRWIDEHVPGVMRIIPGARYYALRYPQKRAIGSLLASWHRDRALRLHKGFTHKAAAEWLEPVLQQFFPGALQQRPPPEPKLPELWKDPVTGETPKNPLG